MKVAVINFSGNVGKSTVAKHLLLPRIEDAEFVSVESINADEGDGNTVRGKAVRRLVGTAAVDRLGRNRCRILERRGLRPVDASVRWLARGR